jgi:Tfp pilus assembly protein PilF
MGGNLKGIAPEKVPLRPLWEKIPFFVFSAVSSIITLYAHHKASVRHFPLGSRIANAPVSLVTHLEKTFWPHDLAAYYSFSGQLPVWQVLVATLLILVISVAVIVMVKRLPYIFVGWLWYAITLAPVIGIIPIGLQVSPLIVGDHYTYLPSIGIAIILAWGIPLLFPREDMRKKILFPVEIAVMAILAVLTWQQCGYWKNSIELVNHTLQVTKDNYLAYSIRGNAYHDLGQYQQAIEDFNEAIRLRRDFVETYNNRGLTYAKLGQHSQAIEDFNEAIRLKPNYVEVYNNRGNAYAKLGQYQRSIEDFNEAIRLKQDYADAYYNRGFVYLLQGNNELGCVDAQKACELGICEALEMAKSRGSCN